MELHLLPNFSIFNTSLARAPSDLQFRESEFMLGMKTGLELDGSMLINNMDLTRMGMKPQPNSIRIQGMYKTHVYT